MSKEVKRPDGRKFDQLREIGAKVGVVENADGSAMFSIGKTKAIAGVYGPRELHPKHMQQSDTGIIRVFYDMMSFSVTERKRPGPSRRSTELNLVIKNALEPVLFLKEFPKATVDVFIEIVQADAGTRCAAICAAALALADAGLRMKDLVVSVSVGKIGDQVVIDLSKEEEDWEDGATDIPVAYVPVLEKITLLQLDGKITREDLKKALELAVRKCKEIYELQKKVLRERFK